MPIVGYQIGYAKFTEDINNLQSQIDAAEVSTASNTATLNALKSSDQEVMIWPLDGGPDWALRIPTDISAGIICSSKNDLAQWKYEELNLGLKTSAVIRVSDTAGFAGLPVQVFWTAAGVGPTLLGSATSSGLGGAQDLTINFGNSVQGPGMFTFKATTPNPIGISGSYSITRCRIRQ